MDKRSLYTIWFAKQHLPLNRIQLSFDIFYLVNIFFANYAVKKDGFKLNLL